MNNEYESAISSIKTYMSYPNGKPCRAAEIAIEALEKQDKYRWHDLRVDPNDLPEKQPKLAISEPVIVWMGDSYWNHVMRDYYDYGNHEWLLSPSRKIHKWSLVQNNDVIAWKYIEPFESKEAGDE